MDKDKGRASTPPQPTTVTQAWARVQALRDSLVHALRPSYVLQDAQTDPSRLSRADLIAEVDRLTETVRRQAELIAQLEQVADKLRSEHCLERRSLAEDQKSILNDQDQFLAKLLEEHEAALAQITAERDQQQSILNDQDRFLAQIFEEHDAALAEVGAERDQAQLRVKELEVELSATYAASSRHHASAREQDRPNPRVMSEFASLQRELGRARDRVDELGTKYRTARETLHRVMRQRDEAQHSAARLAQELRELNDSTARPLQRVPFTSRAYAGSADRQRPSTEQLSPRSEAPQPGRDARPGDTDPAPPRADPSARPVLPSSPLAIALASTDPGRRKAK
jgi:DNA anti-recombination protein RmuC